jgi:predicted AlkP superfamily pyrophosphatase or phosphodiesterase
MHALFRLGLKVLFRSLLLSPWLAILLVSLIAATAPPALAAGSDRARVLILMVWDGLRPDSVSAAATPNLYALRGQGTYFAAHHSTYPSLTMVNGGTLATGASPGANGIIANKMYFAHLLTARG